MKRAFSLVLAIIVAFGILTSVPMTAGAASTSDLTFELNEDGESYSVSGCKDNRITEIVIPGLYKNKPVTGIYSWAFCDFEKLKSITIPDSIENIGNKAFYNTSYYNDEKNWDNKVLYIGDHLIVAYRENEEDGECFDKFSGELSIKKGTKTIADYAFYTCGGLDGVTIPDGVKNIGSNAFSDCTSLVSVTIPDSVVNLGESAFSYCSSLASVKIGANVTSIGDNTFDECRKITSITIPSSVKSIGDSAFCYCTALTTVTIQSGVTSIGGQAFRSCKNLDKITLPNSITNIGEEAFYGTAYYKNSENWTNRVLYIGNHIIKAKTSLTGRYEINTSTRTIADGAFSECDKLTAITLPKSVKTIGNTAFLGCIKLTSISIPNSVTCIGWGAFRACEKITKAIIPDSVKAMGSYVFAGCTNLAKVEIGNNVPEIQASSFEDCVNLTSVQIGSGVKDISSAAFYGCKKLKSINIPDGVKRIGWVAFCGCSSLESITIPGSVEVVGDYAFSSCTNLSSVKICSGVKQVLHHAFISNNNLKKIVVPKSVKTIDDFAFGYVYDDSTGETEKIKGFTIYSYTDSTAQKYAKDNDFKFIDIDTFKNTKPTLKDVENSPYGSKITWGKVNGADSYKVYRKVTGGKWKYLDSTTKTYFTDKTAKSGTKYYYAIKAKSIAGDSILSSARSKYYLADPTLKTPSSTKAGVVLKWSKVTGAEGYMVYRKTGSGSYSKIATVKGSTKVTYTDKTAKKGKKYTYKIKAYKSKTYSACSNTKTITDKY